MSDASTSAYYHGESRADEAHELQRDRPTSSKSGRRLHKRDNASVKSLDTMTWDSTIRAGKAVSVTGSSRGASAPNRHGGSVISPAYQPGTPDVSQRPHSRPTSRAGSRTGSHAGSKAGSRHSKSRSRSRSQTPRHHRNDGVARGQRQMKMLFGGCAAAVLVAALAIL